MVRDPRRVRTRRRLVQQRQRVRVRVEQVGRDEGRVASGEDGEVDHGWALIRRALTGGAAGGMQSAPADAGPLNMAAGCMDEEARSRVPAGRSSARFIRCRTIPWPTGGPGDAIMVHPRLVRARCSKEEAFLTAEGSPAKVAYVTWPTHGPSRGAV